MKRQRPEDNGLSLRASASMPWGPQPSSSASSSFRNGNKSFQDFGKYMNEKKRKLSLQYHAEASNEGLRFLTDTKIKPSSDNAELLGSNTTIASAITVTNDLPKLFHGISIFVDGFTIPSHQELRSLMIKHGGNFENYFSRQLVTHIICSTLPDSKIKDHRSFSRGLPIVKPSWIVDSINCGKVLPISSYFHERIVRENPNQRTISDLLICKITDSSKSLDNAEHVLQEEISHDHTQDGPLQELIEDLPFKNPIKFQQGEKKHDKPNSGLEISSSFSSLQVEHTDSSTQKDDELKSHMAYDSKPLCSTENTKSSIAGNTYPEPDGPYCPNPPSSNRGSVSENVRTHCTLGDSNFVQNYFKNSRLHFIGTWRNRYQSRFKCRDTEPQPENRCGAFNNTSSRIIMHIDMDCFFVSVVVRDRPQLAGKPVAVCHSEKVNGTAEISSSNYAARKFGIKSGMFIGNAKLLCPELEVVRYDFEGYEQVADQLYDILHKYCKKVQAISCDEAFLDVTGIEDPETLASTIRKEIFDMTRCTASVGIAENLLLARLATRKAKPDGQYRIATEEVESFVSNLSIEDLPGVGGSLQEKLHSQAIYNCNQLQAVPKESLQRNFGSKTGDMLWCYARGIDHREVQDYQERKSIGAEVNWGVRFETAKDADHFLTTLCSEVSMRLQNAAVCGRTFTLKVKKRKEGTGEPQKFMGCGSCDNLSKSVTIASATNHADILLRVSKQMFASFHLDVREIRGMGLQATRLESSPRAVNDQTQQRQKLLESCLQFVSKEKHNKNVPNLDHAAVETHKPKDEAKSWGVDKDKKGMKRWGKVVKGPFHTHDRNILDKSIKENKSTRILDLPDVSEVDPSVLAALPKEILAEINTAYKGAFTHQVEESENVIDNQISKTNQPDFPSFNEASTSLSGSYRKPSECQEMVPCHRDTIPFSLSEIDMATLNELPIDIQEDIIKALPGCLPCKSISKSVEACESTHLECIDLMKKISRENLDDLWCGFPPRWISLFEGFSGVGAEILHHLSKSFLEFYPRPFSSVFLHVMCSHHIVEGAWQNLDPFIYTYFMELLRQYLQLRLSSDLEEIYLVARILKRLGGRAQIWLRLWSEFAPVIQAATTESYGGTFYITQ